MFCPLSLFEAFVSIAIATSLSLSRFDPHHLHPVSLSFSPGLLFCQDGSEQPGGCEANWQLLSDLSSEAGVAERNRQYWKKY